MKNSECSISNIYRLDGRVPLLKAVPFGLQHILAMFVSNLTPITIIAAAGGLSQAEVAVLLQNAMLVAGIATLIQLFPVWRIGSRLPIVMGVSFTFVTVLSTVAASYGYPAVIGAVICGGVFEGVIGLFARYWRKIIAPVVASSVVIAIGYSLFTVGARSFGGGYAEDFGSASNLLLGAVTLTVCLGWNILARGYLKQLSVLAGLVVGYILAVFMGKVDLSVIFSEGIVSLPALLPFAPEFHMGAIFSVSIIFMVSAAETHRGHDCHGLWRAGPGDHLKGDFRFPGLRRLCFRRFCPVWMPSGDLIFPECGACEHDEGRKPLYHCHRGRLYAAGRIPATGGELFCIPPGIRSGRVHDHDVRDHHGIGDPDAFQGWIYPAEHDHRRPVALCGYRFYCGQ